MTTNVKTVEVKEANVQLAEETQVDAKPTLIERVKELPPVKFVRKHRIGVAAGVGTAIAAGAAVVVAARNGYIEGAESALDSVGDAVADVVENATDTVA